MLENAVLVLNMSGGKVFVLVPLHILFQLTPSLIKAYGDQSRYRLYLESEYALQTISTQLVSQAIELVDYMVEDLIVLDSQNSILLGYLDRFDAFTAVDANKTEQKLNAFYGLIEEYLDSDTTGDPLRTSSIETQLIALCLQRNGFDRWKRTVQTRTAQLQKLIYRKLSKLTKSSYCYFLYFKFEFWLPCIKLIDSISKLS
ncbi:uncharacterized protein LOC117138617 [Drosophila mauritiana]|uniref:Uncharacterized protein LOC117138617 n=1 Tax=Drosophila mauritiana TaxID=7226 RepID=A0A6P8K2R3_DROMA|nr:uncharacterized protein LOC117138617 [Drosophila mauritiana]